MSALICGSFAFDNIMVFQDRFRNHILPDKIHILNVSFLVPELRREFGGCAGNIAYNLHMIGGAAVPMGTVGEDFAPYATWMDELGIRALRDRRTADPDRTGLHHHRPRRQPDHRLPSRCHELLGAQRRAGRPSRLGIIAPTVATA